MKTPFLLAGCLRVSAPVRWAPLAVAIVGIQKAFLFTEGGEWRLWVTCSSKLSMARNARGETSTPEIPQGFLKPSNTSWPILRPSAGSLGCLR